MNFALQQWKHHWKNYQQTSTTVMEYKEKIAIDKQQQEQQPTA